MAPPISTPPNTSYPTPPITPPSSTTKQKRKTRWGAPPSSRAVDSVCDPTAPVSARKRKLEFGPSEVEIERERKVRVLEREQPVSTEWRLDTPKWIKYRSGFDVAKYEGDGVGESRKLATAEVWKERKTEKGEPHRLSLCESLLLARMSRWHTPLRHGRKTASWLSRKFFRDAPLVGHLSSRLWVRLVAEADAWLAWRGGQVELIGEIEREVEERRGRIAQLGEEEEAHYIEMMDEEISEKEKEEHGCAIRELGSEREKLEEAQKGDEGRIVWMKEQLAEVEETLVPAFEEG